MTIAFQVEFEDALYSRCLAGESARGLAAESGLALEAIRTLVENAADRDRVTLAVDGAHSRPRRRRSGPEPAETWQERDARLAHEGRRWTDALGATSKPSITPDRAVHNPDAEDGLRECRTCLRLFRGGRADAVACGEKCRRLHHRIKRGDPTAADAVAMLFAPPDCEGCGQPLYGERLGAKVHGEACRKRRDRRQVAGKDGR